MAQWANCRVTSAGSDQDNEVRIRLRNLEQNNPFDHTFKAIPSQRKEMLATALTAITTGLHVNVRLEAIGDDQLISNFTIVRS